MEDQSSLPSELLQLSQILENKFDLIAAGSKDIQNAALLATQYLFNQALQSEATATPHINKLISALDPSSAPQTRSKTIGKRKRSPSPQRTAKTGFQTTPLTGLFVDGLSEDQIWAQLDIRTKNVCDILNLILEEDGPLESENESDNDRENDEDEESLLEDAFPVIGGESSDEYESEDEAEEESVEEEQGETVAELRDPSSGEEEESRATSKSSKKRSRQDNQSELDDGFFSLADFNAEIEAAEARSSTRGRLDGSDDETSDEELDYFASIDQDQLVEEGGSNEDPRELYYNDFFVPSKHPRTPVSLKQSGKVRFHEEVRVKKINAKGKGYAVSTLFNQDEDEDWGELDDGDEEFEHSDSSKGGDVHDNGVDEDASDFSDVNSASDEGAGREVIDRFKDDLFAEEAEDVSRDMTSHEKRMATLSEQIAELEAENVAPKEWVLMGEAGSRSRPQNSLLEEDLEFERVAKPAPVITQATVHALEDRIKGRILEGRYDDVVRIRSHEKPFLPSRLFELTDTKSSQSLAQIYEDEYVAAQTGGVVGEDRDGRLRKEHEDIEKLWESICHKLDALSNAHFIPKQPKAIISTISNVPVTMLESALPTSKSATSLLAPEEVYAPASSELRARSEMTPSEKRALRNKNKKVKKKTRELLDKSVDKFAQMKSSKKQKQRALESVVKVGKGVTVVGKKNREILKNKSKKPR